MSRTRRLLALLGATTLAVTLVPLAAIGGGTTIGSAPFVERTPAGTLTLATGAETLTLTYRDPDGNPVAGVADAEHALRKKDRCSLDTTRFEALLDIEVIGGSGLGVGLVSNGLGSRASDTCSTSSGRIESGQSLQLTLALPGGIVVDHAVLDVEGKFGAGLAATGTLFGEATLSSTGISLAGGNDNGADAGALDNTDVTLGTPGPEDDFDVLTLSAVSDDGRGEIALEGGGDHDTPDAKRSVFHLVQLTGYEYALGCGDTVDDDLGDGDDLTGATLTRYADTDAYGEANPCDPIGADLSSDADGVLFRKTTVDAAGDEQAPTTRLTLTWRVELYESDGTTPRPTGEVETELARQIDLLDGAGLQDVQFCLADNDTVDADGDPVLASATRPDDLPWCLLDETIELRDGYLVQIQVYDGSGDPRWL